MTDSTNAASNGRHTPEVHAGKPSPSSGFQDDWVTTKVYFHEFETLIELNGECLVSPAFFCLGYEWRVRLFPRGADNEGEGLHSVSVFLVPESSHAINVTFGLAIGNVANISREHVFKGNHIGFDFIKREKALNCLQHGALVIEVRMKPSKKNPPFIPDNPSACKTIQDMYMDKESADVVFEVGGQHATTRANTKKLKAGAATFYAHRLVLMKAAPQLAELCIVSTESTIIPNVLPCIFNDLLLYIYGCPIHVENDPTRLQNIIEAANIYGVTNLKLETEVSNVSFVHKSFDVKNIMEHLLYADAMNLAYLKEAVMDFIVGNKAEIMKNKVLADAPGDIVSDVLAAVARSEERANAVGKNGDVELRILGISDLRRRAHALGLCVDGSRETLIAAIESMKVVVEKDD